MYIYLHVYICIHTLISASPFFGVLLLTHTICSEVSLNGFRSETVIVILERIIYLLVHGIIYQASRHTSRGRLIPFCDRVYLCSKKHVYIVPVLLPSMRERMRLYIHRFSGTFGCLRRLARSNNFHCKSRIWRRNFLTLGRKRDPSPLYVLYSTRARIDYASERGRFPCSKNSSELSYTTKSKVPIGGSRVRVVSR